MAFTFIANKDASVDGVTANSIDLDFNGQGVTGDLCVVLAAVNHSGGTINCNDNVGTTYNAAGLFLAASGNLKLRVFSGILGGNMPTITVNIGSLLEGEGLAVLAYCFRGSHASTPLDSITSQADGNSTNPDCPAIVPTFNDSLIMAMAASEVSDDIPGTITSYLGELGAAAGSAAPASVGAAYRILSGGAGASENPAAFSAWNTGIWVAVTAAFRVPAEGGTSNMFLVF